MQGRHDGSGVTLSFAKKLIEMHMGVLEVESKCKSETADGSRECDSLHIPVWTSGLTR